MYTHTIRPPCVQQRLRQRADHPCEREGLRLDRPDDLVLGAVALQQLLLPGSAPADGGVLGGGRAGSGGALVRFLAAVATGIVSLTALHRVDGQLAAQPIR